MIKETHSKLMPLKRNLIKLLKMNEISKNEKIYKIIEETRDKFNHKKIHDQSKKLTDFDYDSRN